MELPINSQAVDVVLTNDDEAMFLHDFKETHNIGPLPVVSLGFQTGREADTPEGRLRTMPDPEIGVYERDDSHMVLLYLATSDIVFTAFEVHEDLEGFLLRLVDAIEDEYQGIERVVTPQSEDGYEPLLQRAIERANEHVPARA